MRNIKLIIEYEGAAYHGWQYQKNLPSVQGSLENAILKLTGENTRVTAAGRTDTGVHARGQVANFKIQKKMTRNQLKSGLNAHLPQDIVIKSVDVVNADFNARFQAKQRVYQYFISTEHTALMRNYCWQIFYPLDEKKLNELSTKLIGNHDFGGFCRKVVQSEHKRCIVYESQWQQNNTIWVYRISANRFLHGMVRTIVGTLIDVVRGRFTVQQFDQIFNSCDRTLAGQAAPARGLVLEEVRY